MFLWIFIVVYCSITRLIHDSLNQLAVVGHYILVAKLFFLVSVKTYDCFSKIKLYEWNARSKGILIAFQKYYSSLHIQQCVGASCFLETLLALNIINILKFVVLKKTHSFLLNPKFFKYFKILLLTICSEFFLWNDCLHHLWDKVETYKAIQGLSTLTPTTFLTCSPKHSPNTPVGIILC